MKTTILIAMLLAMNGMAVTVSEKVLAAICHQESKGKNVIGGLHLKEKSYGSFQIRRLYLEDVTKHYSKEMVAKWGKKLTLNDLLHSKEKSQWVATRYLSYWGNAYEKRTGKKCTDETLIRLHYGGPRGAEPKFKKLYLATTTYRNDVMRWYGKV